MDPIYNTIKILKYLISLTKQMKYFYSKNYMTLMKVLKEDTKNTKVSHFHGIRRINFIKTAILAKIIYRIIVVCIKIPRAFFKNRKKHS